MEIDIPRHILDQMQEKYNEVFSREKFEVNNERNRELISKQLHSTIKECLPENDSITFETERDPENMDAILVCPYYKGKKITYHSSLSIAEAIESAILHDTHNLTALEMVTFKLNMEDE